ALQDRLYESHGVREASWISLSGCHPNRVQAIGRNKSRRACHCPPLHSSRPEQLAALTVRHAVPAIHQFRPFAAAGGLRRYGGSQSEYRRLIGAYAGKILKGEKPGDLPVQQGVLVLGIS